MQTEVRSVEFKSRYYKYKTKQQVFKAARKYSKPIDVSLNLFLFLNLQTWRFYSVKGKFVNT